MFLFFSLFKILKMSKEYKDKMDTQGMSGVPIGESKMTRSNKYPVDPVTGKIVYPQFKPLHVSKMIDGDLRTELKELINEVLDERDGKMDY